MNNNCWYELKIDTSNALRKDWAWDVSELVNNMNVKVVDHSIFNIEWLDYMESIGIPIYRAVLFYRYPSDNTRHYAHIDINKTVTGTVPWAINWVIGGENSKMVWYNFPKDYYDLSKDNCVERTMANTPYVSWKINDLTEIEQREIKNVSTLVRTDIPHSITMGEVPRWCISIKRSLSYTWEELIVHLRSKNLLIERN